jgi:hypothetical protein
MYFHTTLCDFRREEITFAKLSIDVRQKKERNPNVFSKWVEDDQKIIDACCTKDFEFWKVPNFAKDPVEYKSI